MSNEKSGRSGKLPRINVYVCEYNCNNVTVDVDHGVTPFMIKCRRKSTPQRPIAQKYLDENGECIGTARSCFYPMEPKPAHIPDPTHEWFKPDTFEGLHPDEIDHVKRGGLLLRERTDREPIFHEEPKGAH